MRSFLVSSLFLAACGVDHSGQDADTGSEAPASGGFHFGSTGGSSSGGSDDSGDAVDTDSDDTDDTVDTDSADTEDTADDTAECEETQWYLDTDGDGFGLTSSSKWSCEQPSGYVAIGGDLNDGNSSVHNVTRICAVTSNGEPFSVAVEDITNGDRTHWFGTDGKVANPLFISTDADWCAEYPEATAGTDVLKISGLTTTVYGYGDFIVYSCGGDDSDSVFYDGDTTCATVTFSVNGYAVETTASDSFDYQYN